jgi:LPS sulfotransferase NodH
LPGHRRFRRVFGDNLRAIVLRRNCLRAAISLWRAEVSGVWSLAAEEKPPPPPPALDLWRVTLLHTLMHAGEIGWPHLLNSINVNYMTLHYHDIAISLRESLHRVGDFIGVEIPDSSMPATPGLRRQADAATERFIEEWWRATGGCASCENDNERVS